MISQDVINKVKQADLANVIRKVKDGKPLSTAERKLLDASKTPEVPKKGKRSSSIKHAIGITGFPKDAFDWALENGCPHIDDHGRVEIELPSASG
jgi:hypothetical protein